MHEEDTLIQLVGCAYRLQEPAEIKIADWRALCRLGDRHRVTPALAPVVQTSFPPLGQEWIDAALVKAGQQIILVRRALHQVAGEFRSRGIEALILKGLALQDWVYERQCRVTGDIDLFVKTSDLHKLSEVLRALGFMPFPHSGARTWRNTEGIEIDVHTSMFEPYIGRALKFEDVWEQRMELERLPLPTLSPVDHMVFVLIHGWKHQWCRLSWIVDVALIAQRLSDQEWQKVRELAQKQSALRIIQVGLELCRLVLQPPGVAWDRVLDANDKTVELLAREYRRRLFVLKQNSLSAKVVNTILHIRALEGFRLRSQYMAGRLMNTFAHQTP